jgi:diacylglycerol kinase family enzyme
LEFGIFVTQHHEKDIYIRLGSDDQVFKVEMTMRYAIITNPAAGKMTVDRKRLALSEAARILKAPIHGLDTISAVDFTACARRLAGRCDVLVVAGGDGTVSHVINSIDTARTPIAYLPLGTGNALGHALNYRGPLAELAARIRDGCIRRCDLIDCGDERRAFMASIGIGAKTMMLRDIYLARGQTGFRPYLQAFIRAYFKEKRRADATIKTDETTVVIHNLIDLMVVKQSYFGYGMKVVPKARLDDGRLHLLALNSGPAMLFLAGISAFTLGNRVGEYISTGRVSIRLDHPFHLQIDGSYARKADRFTFTILPRALKLKY